MGTSKEYVLEGLDHTHVDSYSIQANILVNKNGRACLADFGLLTIEPDAAGTTSSDSFQGGGTTRWMGPELFYPEKFGLTGRRLTKSSDCYALGMVVYEVLSGKVPFHHYKYHNGIAAVRRILDGDRPERPQGDEGLWFTDALWNALECCWKPTPGDRPSAEDVLHGLEKASMSWTPAQTVACPPAINPPTLNLCSSTGESTDDETYSTSQTNNAIHFSEPPLALDPEEAFRRLVGGAVPQDELPSLIETVVSNLKATNIVRRLQESDAQTFIDVIDQVYNITPSLRNRCIANFSLVRHLTGTEPQPGGSDERWSARILV